MATHIGRYVVVEKIAHGGMATVYLARVPTGYNRFVALKVLHPHLSGDSQHIEMLADEAALLARLKHPNTVRLYEHGFDGENHFLAMELLVDESVLGVWRALSARKAKFPLELVAWLGARIADGLHHAHELRDPTGALENVVHRDVNPSNLFITLDGRVKIIDFGLAKSRQSNAQTQAGYVKGKIAYLSPEQLQGRAADRRADIFALGTTLWELALDKRLFRQEDDVDTLRAIQKCAVPDPRSIDPSFPAKLATVLMRALQREPRERYQTAGEMSVDLDACTSALGGADGAKLAHLMTQIGDEARGSVRPAT
jgi:serine/threonine-protein kinase